MDNQLLSILKDEMTNTASGWSVGSFGAIGEYLRDEDERLIVDDIDNLTCATERGAICLTLPSEVVPVAYETLSPSPRRWGQGLALCLPDVAARTHALTVLTEIGRDHAAVRPSDRDDILFDIGLGQPQIDFCIRTRDPALLEILRACEGKPTFGSAAGGAILAAHPHRIVASRLGRIEVFQKIGGPETGGVSPEGPHTHVLPKLMASGRTHSANTPIPAGLVPCAYLHPASPVLTLEGADKAFEPVPFETFARYLELYGASSSVAQKKMVWSAIDNGLAADSHEAPRSRHDRAALRIALRQALRRSELDQDVRRASHIATWCTRFDRGDTTEASGCA